MSINIQHEFDTIYETMILLYLGYDVEKFKNDAISELNDSGGDGEGIYHKYLKAFDKYVRNFQKNRIADERDAFFFEDISFGFFSSLVTPFLMEKDFFNSIGQMDNQQVMEILFRYSEEIFERKLPDYSKEAFEDFIKTENLILFVNSLDLKENEKWKVLLILQNPQDYYSHFTKIIIKNIPAYEQSIQIVKPLYEKYLEQFSKAFSSEKKAEQFLIDNNLKNCGIQEIIPSMASSTGIIITDRSCYYGLMFEKVKTALGLQSNSKEYLITCLKALGDHSKFEILISLKNNPKYATELAEQLGLTSATVSHHMGTLLAAHMVYLEKENGKYYYHLDEVTLKEIIDQLRHVLL